MDFTPAINALMTGGLQGWQLAQEHKLRKAQIAKNNAGLSESGFDVEGNVDPGFYDENNPSYKRAKQAALFKTMGSAKAAPTTNALTFRQVFSARGIPLPKDLEGSADQPFDHRYAGVLPPLARQGEPQVDAELIRNPDEYLKNNPGTKVTAPFASNIKPIAPRPGNTPMTPEQQGAYEQMMGLPAGSAKNLTTGNFASGVSNVSGQRAAGERQGKAIAATDARQEKSHDLRRETAVMTPVKSIEVGNSMLDEIASNIDSFSDGNPSWTDYQALRAKGAGAKYTGGFIGGMTPDEEARLGKYNALGQGFVRNLFARGGKTLTPTEERLAGRFELAPGDTNQQMRAKASGLADYMEKELGAEISAIEPVNPKRAAELRQKLAGTISRLRRMALNPSQLRAQVAQGPQAKAGAPVTAPAVDSGKKLGIKEDKLKGVRQFPTKGKVVRQQYNASLNKTKLIYDTGEEVVVDGKP